MESNYEFKLNLEEYEEMITEIKKKEEVEKRKKELQIILKEGSLPPEIMHKRLNSDHGSELMDDDFELNWADVEDNSENLENEGYDEDSISLGYGDSDQEIEDLFEGGGFGKGKALNNSFTGPYGSMDHLSNKKEKIPYENNTQFAMLRG
jgi:hypothetical protein